MAEAIEIKGVDELIKKLGKVEGRKVLRQPMDDSMALVKASAMQYPQPIPNSTYVRTNVLKNSWSKPENTYVKDTGNGLQGTVGTNVEYAPWVVSHQFQARIHWSRWPTDRGILAKHRPAIVKLFQSAIDKALR